MDHEERPFAIALEIPTLQNVPRSERLRVRVLRRNAEVYGIPLPSTAAHLKETSMDPKYQYIGAVVDKTPP